MKDNEWISTKDAMPGIGKCVKIIYEGDELKSEFYYSNSKNKLVFYYNDSVSIDPEKVYAWKNIPEKRPDFSKLKRGDLIYINTENPAYRQIGFYCEHDNFTIKLSEYKDLDSYEYCIADVKDITKITRINLEKQTFEEI